MVTVSVDAGCVDVDVELSDFDTDDLVGEVEERGYTVLENEDPILCAGIVFSKQQREAIIQLIDEKSPSVGSVLYFCRDDLARA